MGAGLASLGRACYGFSLLMNMLWTSALIKLVVLFPLGVLTKQGVCLMIVQMGWRLAHFFSPWVSTVCDEDYQEQWSLIYNIMAEADAEAEKTGKPAKPLFILANHTSFLDTVLAVVKMPSQVLWRCRTYMDHHLFKLPLLSTICRAVGHFPVYFTSNETGKFKVDAERMEEVENNVGTFLDNGGWMSFFPEGQLNKTPDKLLPFRFGGMKKALDRDARIVTYVFRGNPTVWPVGAQVGGFPGKVRYSLRVVAPDGAKAFVDMARAEGCKEEKDMADHEILARRVHELMQAQYDTLAKPPGSKKAKAA